MTLLYCTADVISSQTGGGRVTQEESTALFDLGVETDGTCEIWGRERFAGSPYKQEPWGWDDYGEKVIQFTHPFHCPLAHFYAGTFTKTIQALKARNPHCKITYTAAAHDISLSEREHQRLGLNFNYPHLTDPHLWDRYVEGYRQADVVICPSQHSAECMRRYGCEQIRIIPHGVNIPEEPFPLPHDLRVGYLGAVGPDKGLIYLLQAWKKLSYPNAVLYLAGRDSQSPFVRELVKALDLTNVKLLGWVDDIAWFYKMICLYVQPSVTEGFGIEILEALAHARPVLCSTGAGAADVVPETWKFPAANVDALADKMDQFCRADLELMGKVGRELAKEYTWAKIRQRYQETWRSLLE